MKIIFSIILTLVIVSILAIVLRGLDDDLRPADLAVVLGNKVNPDGTPSPQLKARLDHAVDLYHQNYFKLVLVSGAHGKEGYDEPIVMRHYLEAHGIPADAIFEDNKGTNTWETARNTAAFLAAHHLSSVLIISQYFHIARCQLAFSRFDINPVFTSHAPYWCFRDFFSVPREIVACAAYYFYKADQPAKPASSG